MVDENISVGFLGFGHMAQIICRSLERAKAVSPSQMLFHRRDPQKAREAQEEFGITATSLETLVAQSDLILLCVRPAQAELVLREMKRLGMEGKKLVSILAGAGVSYFEKFLGPIPLIRAMPNIASEVGEGMTILTPGPHADPKFREETNRLFSCMGNTVELPEQFMDLATGIAGSGPAFAFVLMDALARLGEQAGIPYEKGLKMASQTFLGAAQILLKGGVPVEDLLRQIAVPNGTTEAGLKAMRELEVGKRYQDVISAAAKRSAEISREISK